MISVMLAVALCGQDPDATSKKVEELIQALGDESVEARQKAVDDLAKIGKPALAALNKALQSADAEVKKRAQEIIDKIHWGRGYGRLEKYVQERYEKDEAKIEPLKVKAFQAWFPDTRFYEVADPQPAAGAMMVMGGGGRKSVFAVRKDEDALIRIMVQGIVFTGAVTDLLARTDVRLDSDDRAFDFATAFLQLYSSGQGASHVYYGGAPSRFAKVKDGWELTTPTYGTSLVFKTDAGGKLLDVASRGPNWQVQGEETAEKLRLETEKLKLEIEVLKRQLEKK